MVVQREDSEEVDTYVNEQEVDVEEGGATLEDERGRKVAGMKEVVRDNGDDVDSGMENNVEDVEKSDSEDLDVDADG